MIDCDCGFSIILTLYRSYFGLISVQIGHIGPISVLYRSCIGPISVLYRSYIGPISVLYRSYIGPISVLYRSYIGPISVHTSPILIPYRSYIDPISVLYRFILALYRSYIGPYRSYIGPILYIHVGPRSVVHIARSCCTNNSHSISTKVFGIIYRKQYHMIVIEYRHYCYYTRNLCIIDEETGSIHK